MHTRRRRVGGGGRNVGARGDDADREPSRGRSGGTGRHPPVGGWSGEAGVETSRGATPRLFAWLVRGSRCSGCAFCCSVSDPLDGRVRARHYSHSRRATAAQAVGKRRDILQRSGRSQGQRRRRSRCATPPKDLVRCRGETGWQEFLHRRQPDGAPATYTPPGALLGPAYGLIPSTRASWARGFVDGVVVVTPLGRIRSVRHLPTPAIRYS